MYCILLVDYIIFARIFDHERFRMQTKAFTAGKAHRGHGKAIWPSVVCVHR